MAPCPFILPLSAFAAPWPVRNRPDHRHVTLGQALFGLAQQFSVDAVLGGKRAQVHDPLARPAHRLREAAHDALGGDVMRAQHVGEDALAADVLDELGETAVARDGSVYWQGANHDGYYDDKVMASDIRTTALALSAAPGCKRIRSSTMATCTRKASAK
ncbi:MAG: hypothetical protein HC829_07175 [Bacteroidales bacterium]|nr:hypothetical protein [Bacteroidales bacterium]